MIKTIPQPAKAGDRIIAKGIQKHHKPLKAVTESLIRVLNHLSVTTAVVFLCVNFYAIILPLLSEL